MNTIQFSGFLGDDQSQLIFNLTHGTYGLFPTIFASIYDMNQTHISSFIGKLDITSCVTTYLDQRSISVDIHCVVHLLEESDISIDDADTFGMSVEINHAKSERLVILYDRVELTAEGTPEFAFPREVHGGNINNDRHQVQSRLMFEYYTSPKRQQLEEELELFDKFIATHLFLVWIDFGKKYQGFF